MPETTPRTSLQLVSGASSGRSRPPRHLADLDPGERTHLVEGAGLPGYRARQLSRHYFTRLVDDPDEMTDLPARRRDELVRTLLPPLLTPVRTQDADCGATRKTLWRLFDGVLVESVLMRYPGRVTMCVSSQAGCGMACPFCATGQAGLQRNLSAAEIVDQQVTPAAMPDYDHEAPSYDETRGGEARANAAAEAIASLLTVDGPVVDLAGGTGIVSVALAQCGRDVFVVDRSHGMLSLAQQRLPGRVMRGDARRLPIAAGTVAAIAAVWLLHLLDDAEPVIAEAARVLLPGGVFATTVDKATSHGYASEDRTDRRNRVVATARSHRLELVGSAAFVGHGQGRDGGADPTYTVLALRKCQYW